MQLLGGELGGEEFGLPFVGVAGREAALDPDLRGAVILPVGKQAHAVAAGEDLFEMMLQVVEGKILVDGLRHLKCGLHVEGHARDHAH